MRIAIVALLLAVAALVACGTDAPGARSTPTPEPARPTPSRAPPPIAISVEQGRYDFANGPIRSDLLELSDWRADPVYFDTSRMDESPLALYFNDAEPDWLVAEFAAQEAPGNSPDSFPACVAGYGAFVYVPEGSPDPPTPYGFPPPANPLATPAPTIITHREVPLTEEGLLAIGWPDVGMDQITVSRDGKLYRFAAFQYLEHHIHPTSLPESAIRLESVMELRLAIDGIELPDIQGLELVGETAVRYLAILGPADSDQDVLILDTCPPEADDTVFAFFRRAAN